ncbi:MAG: GlsB/YeaQ/YmgE family stress response membrane protein [Devosia sp.]|nr:GlsB/YeaQ/YmgE family stress response membrane protein [Devosia sp.]
MSGQTIIIWILVGLVAGWIASRIVGGRGIIRYIVAGLLGSIVGGFIFSYFGINVPISNEWVREILISTVGAIVVIVVARVIA